MMRAQASFSRAADRGRSLPIAAACAVLMTAIASLPAQACPCRKG